MNKALRSKDFAVGEVTRPELEHSFLDANLNRLVSSADPTFSDLEVVRSAVRRAAELEIIRFDALAKIQAPASANGAVSSSLTSVSEIEAVGDIGVDLGKLAAAKDFFRPVTMNPVSPKARPATFSPVQEWEGYVVEVLDDRMIANLVDLTAHDRRPTSTVEIPLEELDSADVRRLRPGRIFRWAIGYLRSPSGTKSRYSNIVFRDLPQWTEDELITAKREAAEMAEYFSRSDDESNAP